MVLHAKNYDPDYWAKLIKDSGAKYSVITSRHHDGFSLWDTKFGNLNAVTQFSCKKRCAYSICKCTYEIMI